MKQYTECDMILNTCVNFFFIQANIYLFKGNNRNTRKRSKIWPKLAIEMPEGRH